VWVYPDGDILEWRAVPADRSGFPVRASRVTVNLPSIVPIDQVQHTAFGPGFDTQVTGQQVIFESTEPIPDGTRFQVQVGFPHGLVSAAVQPWQENADSAKLVYRMEALDVDLTIGAGGQLSVEERQRVAIDAGALYVGHREISARYLDAISDVRLFEGDRSFTESDDTCDYCFRVVQVPGSAGWAEYDAASHELRVDETQIGEVDVVWQVPPLVKGEATTFRIAYTVEGAILVREDEQLLDWTAVFSGREVPVESARVRVHLPPGLSPEDVVIEGGEVVIEPDGVVRVVHSGPVAAGEAWPVKIAMPAGATSARTPEWQQAMDRVLAAGRQAEADRARLQMAFGAGALLILFGGLAGLVLVWYRWGRDKPAGPVADYLKEPPSDLPPGIVAYLLDERPTTKGVLASLFHLANLGLLRITLVPGIRLQRNWGGKLEEGQTIQSADGEPVRIPSHLVTLYNTLREAIPKTRPVSLDHVSDPFRRVLPEVYAAMGYEAERFFSSLPATARHRWLVRGQWMVLGGFVISAAALCKLGLGSRWDGDHAGAGFHGHRRSADRAQSLDAAADDRRF